MKTSDDLFHLIKSLTVNEKRHFKLFSSTYSGEKKYLRLFDAIEEQDRYDERAILKNFPKEKFTNNFSVAKAYLYNSVLKSLELFNADSTDTLQTRTLISRAELLASKNLTDQAIKLLKKAKTIAGENDNYAHQLEISQFEDTLVGRKSDIKWLRENMGNVIVYENKVIEKFRNFQQYRALGCDFLIWGNSTGTARTKRDVQQLESSRNFQLLKDPSNALSDRAMISHLHFNALYNHVIEDHKNSLRNFIMEKKFIEQSPSRKVKYLSSYISTVNNILEAGIGILGFDELIQTAESLLAIKHPTIRYQKKTKVLYYSSVLNICIKYVKLQEALIYANETRKLLKLQNNESDIEHTKNIYFYLAYIYFLNEENKESLKWLNKFLMLPKDIRSGIYTTAQLLSIAIHFELGNQDLLEYTIRVCYRSLLKSNKLYKYEKLILDFVRYNIPEINNKKEIAASFTILKTKLELIFGDPYEKKAINTFDFVSWLESKIQNRSFAAILREKALQKSS